MTHRWDQWQCAITYPMALPQVVSCQPVGLDCARVGPQGVPLGCGTGSDHRWWFPNLAIASVRVYQCALLIAPPRQPIPVDVRSANPWSHLLAKTTSCRLGPL